ncbi:hypothetical protein M9H77_06790 [Catharanthus roseus]|uniref:Uncharacterized protein n=1 Tax=Catharanthus roseus TaxID=4058 RepID=A0ACC0BT80_CATRO|nr:hypothetical protein M9H77_06790 [Catharanthus roseus]
MGTVCRPKNHVEDIEHVFFQCWLLEETWLHSPFSRLLGMLYGSATAVLERMMEWLSSYSSRFSYFIWYIKNGTNNLIFDVWKTKVIKKGWNSNNYNARQVDLTMQK